MQLTFLRFSGSIILTIVVATALAPKWQFSYYEGLRICVLFLSQFDDISLKTLFPRFHIRKNLISINQARALAFLSFYVKNAGLIIFFNDKIMLP